MFILIVGGGKVGSYLTRALLKQDHEVLVVEKIEKKARELDNLIDRQVTVVGDGCDPLILEQAGIARADVVVADTGDDEDNLVVVLIAKKKTKAKCIARVNNPRNKTIFESLDLEDPVTVISSTEIILDVLNERVNECSYGSALETMRLFGKGKLQLARVVILPGSQLDGTLVADAAFPSNCVVVAIDDGRDELTIPDGDTRLRAGNAIIAIVKEGAGERIHEMASPTG
ncbi:MAG: TrkA family potassium uptake protein [Candidatus Eremiobacteraeota bacterium]|nr:TrkA family potassium uptake protein [Candidatus Eremiobacteraeota bacterium]